MSASTQASSKPPNTSPDRARMVWVVVPRSVLNFSVQLFDPATHGVGVVDVDVVVLTIYRLLDEWLLHLHT